jgi:hypothetical protein
MVDERTAAGELITTQLINDYSGRIADVSEGAVPKVFAA